MIDFENLILYRKIFNRCIFKLMDVEVIELALFSIERNDQC